MTGKEMETPFTFWKSPRKDGQLRTHGYDFPWYNALGGALAGSMLAALPHVPVAQLSSLQQTFVSSFHATFLACAAIAALGIATSLVRGKERG
jgi:hypothetical protein